MSKEKSKTPIRQDDSLSIYPAFESGAVHQACTLTWPALLLCILTHDNDTTGGDMTSVQTAHLLGVTSDCGDWRPANKQLAWQRAVLICHLSVMRRKTAPKLVLSWSKRNQSQWPGKTSCFLVVFEFHNIDRKDMWILMISIIVQKKSILVTGSATHLKKCDEIKKSRRTYCLISKEFISIMEQKISIQLQQKGKDYVPHRPITSSS